MENMNFKDIMISIREICLVSIFILLLVMPRWVNDRLEAAGFTSINFGVAEWEKTIEESKKEVEEVKKYTEETQQKLSAVSEKLEQLTNSPNFSNAAEMRQQVQALKIDVDQSKQKLMQSNTELERSINNHNVLLNKVAHKKIEN